jgi:3-dehydroquinate dehydratase type I
MKLVATIYEQTFDAALAAIPSNCDLVELRAEHLGAIDLHALRAATPKPIILTYRGGAAPAPLEAIDAGIDFIDVEWKPELRIDLPRERVVLSHHDYEGFELAPVAAMRAHGCAYTKLAVTPQSLDDNFRLLEHARDLTVIGMGERGLFSRILAPFRGSELTFVAAGQSAAPGQLTLDRALAIYGDDREHVHATHIFAIAGNPAGHSLSPTIHNPLFRKHGVDAAYTIASFETFEEIVSRREIRGLSVTAPFKEIAMRYADRLGENAREAGAINTLVRMRDGSTFGDNTDVDGFLALIGHPKNVAIVGAGGTARAALVACRRIGANVRVFNRSQRELASEPLDALQSFDGDLIIDTLPVAIDLPDIPTITARYPGGGEALLQAQAIRQNEIFIEALT